VRSWLTEYIPDDVISPIIPESTPIDGLHSTKISRQTATVPLADLSVIEQYVLGFSYFLGVGAYFLNDDSCEIVTETLKRLMGMTKRGKVWLRGDFPALLNINEFTDDAIDQLKHQIDNKLVSPVVKHLYVKPEHHEDESEVMKRYRVKKDMVSPLTMHPDLRLICDFLRGASWPDKITTLQVSGWYLENLDEPNEIISMLMSRYGEVDLIVYPSNGRVRYITAYSAFRSNLS
jgi:hypothetical protein